MIHLEIRQVKISTILGLTYNPENEVLFTLNVVVVF